MFGMPGTTEYDLKFSLLGIPVRVHPFFWLVAAFLGWQGRKVPELLLFIACVFLSILVHEFGHALTTIKAFRHRPSVILYFMGGLCVSEGRQDDLWRRAWVVIMGPMAGFILFGITLGLGLWILGVAEIPFYGQYEYHRLPGWFRELPRSVMILIYSAYSDLLWINLFWGLFNLLPIFPLDGGQLSQVFLTMHNRREGLIRCHAISLVVAGLAAVYFFSKDNMPTALFMASLAAMNLQLYQTARMQQSSFSQFEEDDDWWRR